MRKLRMTLLIIGMGLMATSCIYDPLNPLFW